MTGGCASKMDREGRFFSHEESGEAYDPDTFTKFTRCQICTYYCRYTMIWHLVNVYIYICVSHDMTNDSFWLVVGPPLWKMMDFVNWDYDYSQLIWENAKFMATSPHQPDGNLPCNLDNLLSWTYHEHIAMYPGTNHHLYPGHPGNNHGFCMKWPSYLATYLSLYFSIIYLSPIYPSIYLFLYFSIHQSINQSNQSIYLSIYQSINHLSITYLPIYLSIYLSIHLSIYPQSSSWCGLKLGYTCQQ